MRLALPGAVLLTFLVCGCTTSEPDSGGSGEESAREDTTCESLADESITISEDQDIQLLKVRKPVVKRDNRDTYTEPTGTKDALLMSCTGTGVWSNGTTTPVLIRYTVDADGDEFVQYRETP